MIKTNDKWFRILIILLPVLVSIFINGLLAQPLTLLKLWKALVSFTSIILICEAHRYILYNSYRWVLPGKGNGKRALIVISLGIVFTTLILAATTLIQQYISTGKWNAENQRDIQVYINSRQLTLGLLGYSFLKSIFIAIFLFIVYEALYHFAKLRQTEQEKERLEKEKLKAELQQLKGIINPHFLFNNLNSLSALISEDPAKAEFFLDELTKVFRYLLRNNDTELTTLASELQFIQSYYHLLQIRYGEGINMRMAVEKEYDELMIPPLTLQLLVENAVKHNRLQKDNPLQIELYSAPGKKLVVRNNIAKKDGIVESTGIGLQNINARYRMLNRQGVMIEHTEQDFSVIIPLIH